MLNTGRKLPAKSKPKLKSTARKALRDVSNDVNVSSRSCIQKKLPDEYEKGKKEKPLAVNHNGSLDRLRLIHADLSSLFHQIDELIGQAVNLTDKDECIKEIDTFANVLYKMQNSLEPWVPRFKKSLSDLSTVPSNLTDDDSISTLVKSPEEMELISPSPLVSWRADCIDRGSKQLFLLTPLPRQKEHHHHVIPKKPVSPETCQNMDRCMIVMTPSIKVSPPKSCVLLEPVPRFPQMKSQMVRKSTPFPVKVPKFDASEDSELSSSCHNKPMKYHDFLEISLGYNYENRRQAVEESPNWLLSPPKTCVLMEPCDEEEPLLEKGVVGIGSKAVECTPMLLESAFSIRTGGKPKGENTLKKELWAKFEAVTKTGINDSSTSETASRRGFLELLDEVS